MTTTLQARPKTGDQADLLDIAGRMLGMRNDEKAVILMLRLMLTFKDLERAWGLPKIERYRFEFCVPGGRIDLLLFHSDRSVTIVEAKSESDQRTIAAGIGQLCMYAALLPGVLKGDQKPARIRRVLCAPIEPESSLDLMAACRLAGVEFAPLPSFAFFRRSAAPLEVANGAGTD